MDDIAYSAAVRRGHHDHRLAIVARSRRDAADQLAARLRAEGDRLGSKVPGRPQRLVFVCAGQGTAWPGMGRILLVREPAFRDALERCDACLASLAGWSLLERFGADAPPGPPVEAAVVQPMLLALQVGLAALWRSWGIVPDAVVGHSLGEVAAAHLAGALTLEDAFRIAHHRGRLMGRVAGLGHTAALGLSPEKARPLLDAHAGRLAIAALNGPADTTISGEPEAVRAVVATLRAQNIFARLLDVDCAFHGPQMAPLAGELAAALSGLQPRPTSIPLLSTVTGATIDGRDLDANYWGRNLRETVRFSTAIQALAEEGPATFLEIGPHPALGGAIARTFRERDRPATVLPSLRRDADGREALLRSLGALYTLGHPIDWRALYPSGRFVRLPAYPWRRERFWLEDEAKDVRRNGRHHPSDATNLATRDGEARDPDESDADDLYELRWRRRDRVVLPGADGLSGPWLVLADAGGVGRALGADLEARGAESVVVPVADLDAEGCRRLVSERPYRGVVHLGSLDNETAGEPTLADLDEASRRGVGSALALVQALAGLDRGSRPRLWLVTQGGQDVPEARRDGPIPGLSYRGLAQAPLWGLGRSIAQEYPGSWGGLIDLDPEAPGDDEAAALLDEMLVADGEDQVAFRGGLRFVARLASKERRAPRTEALALRPDGTYLITGGLGDLGLRSARWLAERGARRLVLLGRRALPRRATWDDLAPEDPARAAVEAIRDLERLGATVKVAAADVADREGMAAFFDRLRDDLPPLRGILHAAGVVTPETIRDLDREALGRVLRPKVAGTWVLHELTRDLPLDFFVLYSSVASVLGAKEAHYAAANQFLDAYARAANAQGRPALSVNWGPWAGAGMAASGDRARGFELLGLTPLDPDHAFRALEGLIAEGASQAVAADADWSTLSLLYGQGRRGRLLEEMSELPRQSSSTAGEPDDWRRMPLERRRERLVQEFRERVAGVLHLEPERIDPERPLNTLGLDSLTAIELKGGVEADLGASLSLATLMQGPTLVQLADEVLAQWETPAPPPSSTPGPAAEPLLSFGQRSLWYAHQLDPSGAAYNMAGAARVKGAIDVEVLRRSLRRLADRHAALRTTFAEVDGEPVARVHETSEAGLLVEDASGRGEAEVLRRLADEADRPFDLEAGPLFRASLFTRSPHEHFLLLVAHHIVCDFWSFAVLLHELGAIVAAERDGGDPPLEPLRLQFTDVARRESERLAGPEGERLRSYWQGQLAGPLPVLDLPADRPRPAIPSHRGGSRTLRLDPDLSRRLADLGASHGATLYVTLLAAFQALLARLSGQEDLIVGSPVASRGYGDLGGVVGYFVNPLPLRADLSGRPTFVEFLGRVRQVVLDALEHEAYPSALLQQARDAGHTPLFRVMFVFQKAQRLDSEALTAFALREDGPALDLAGFSLESIALEKRTAQFDLTLMMAEGAGGLTASLEYSADLFDAATADRMLERFRALLEGIVARPDAPVAALPVLNEAERRSVLVDWNATRAEFPRDRTIHGLVEDQARRAPAAVAVEAGGREWTYGEVDARANQLARYLRRLGVGPEVRVALCVERSAEMVVGILGILKAGGAYVPIDPEYPAERLAFLMEDAKAPVLLTQEHLLGALPDARGRAVCLDSEWGAIAREGDRAPGVAVAPETIAYVIYTSGSTGTPKGVPVSHRNLVHSTHARTVYYREPVGRFLLLSSFAFDSSVAGIFWTLCQGGRLVLPPKDSANDPARIAATIAGRGITHVLCVPTLYGLILSEASTLRSDALRAAIAAGEPCPSELPARHRGAYPGAELFNEYGPTEATVWCSVYRCPDGEPAGRVPIGRPIPNARVYVLDADLGPAPIGVPGELYVGGEGVARGYLDRPGLTAERFVPDPFAEEPGARLYRTGDLVRWRGDGELEFLGRADCQVKIRGHRVELGEVESALGRHPDVREAVAVALEEASGDRRLVAYVVPVNGHVPPSSELRRWLRASLPDPLVPSAIVPLEAIPLSPNGKVDRNALPPPAQASPDPGVPFEPPRTPVEEALARASAEVLGLERVGILENFFDLGVDSIQALRIVSRARRDGLHLSPGALFQHQTVAALASAVAEAGGPAVADEVPTLDGPAVADGGDVEDTYPLSPAQEGMLYHTLDAPETGVYVQQFTCVLRGDVRVDTLARSWQRAVDRHPVLRTAFPWAESDRPLQVVHRHVDVPIAEEDWRGLAPEEQARRLEESLKADRARGFVPSLAPLLRLASFRLADDARQLVWTYHHLLMDGWCLPILLREVLAGYEGDGPEPPRPRPFRDYIDWLARRDPAEADAYWRRVLRGFAAPTPLGVDRPGVNPPNPAEEPFAERSATLPAATTAALSTLARTHQLTLNTVVQGAYALLLSRYGGREDVVYGVTVSGRPADLDGAEAMIGMFINTLPVRVLVDEDAALLPWLAWLQRDQVELRRHEWSPLVRVHGASDVPRGRPLFESIFVFENYPVDAALPARAGRLGIEGVRFLERTNYPLTVMVFPGAELRLRVGYDTRRFDAGTIERMLGHLQTLLEGFLAGPDRRLADLPLLSRAEQEELLRRGAGIPPDPADLDRLSDEELESMLDHYLIADEARDE